MHPLASYLIAKKPDGMMYSDAVTLCFRLFCTVDGVPHGLLPLSKQTLSEAFSQLSSVAWVQGADVADVSSQSHWIGMIDSTLKTCRASFDIERGEALAREAGFVDGR